MKMWYTRGKGDAKDEYDLWYSDEPPFFSDETGAWNHYEGSVANAVLMSPLPIFDTPLELGECREVTGFVFKETQ